MIFRQGFRVRVGKVAEQRKADVGIVIAECTNLQLRDELPHAVGRRQDRRHGHDGSQMFRHALAQRQLRQRPRGDDGRQNRVDEADGQFADRQQREQADQRHHQPRRAVVAGVQQHACFEHRGRRCQAAEITERGMPERQSPYPFGNGRHIADFLFKLETAA